MSRYKFIILIFMVIKSLYYSEAGNDDHQVDENEEGKRISGMYEIKNKEFVEVPETVEMEVFKKFKSYFPNIGEIYEEYFSDRRDFFKIKGCSEAEFTRVLNSYPRFLETEAEFINRIKFEKLDLSNSTSSTDYYIGLRLCK
eukprot:XP_016655750.1 PREDICTED: uncharacterized protein LOC100573887 isoform X2 [Acyrthosiphon pisum]